jgi:hypothetical protein
MPADLATDGAGVAHRERMLFLICRKQRRNTGGIIMVRAPTAAPIVANRSSAQRATAGPADGTAFG